MDGGAGGASRDRGERRVRGSGVACDRRERRAGGAGGSAPPHAPAPDVETLHGLDCDERLARGGEPAHELPGRTNLADPAPGRGGAGGAGQGRDALGGPARSWGLPAPKVAAQDGG
jgi:hypothetical protein